MRPRFECREQGLSGVELAHADRRFDPVERGEEGDVARGDVARAPKRIVGVAEPEFEVGERPVGQRVHECEAVSDGQLASFCGQRSALFLGTAVRRDQSLHHEPVGGQIVLAQLAREPQALGGAGRRRGWAADAQLRVRETRKDLREKAERAAGARPSGCRLVKRVGAFVVAEEERSASGEQNGDGLVGQGSFRFSELLFECECGAQALRSPGKVALKVGTKPDEQLHEHAIECGVFDLELASKIGDHDRSIALACIQRGDAGEVEQLERALAVERRHLRRGSKEEPVRIGGGAAGQLDQTEVAVDVGLFDCLRRERPRPLEEHPRSLDPSRHPRVLGGQGQSPRTRQFVRRQYCGPLEGTRRGGEAAP